MAVERRDDREVLEKLDEIHTDVKEMRTAIFGPEYDPKMGFVYRVEKRFEQTDSDFKDDRKRIKSLEDRSIRQIAYVGGALGALQIVWEWIKFKVHP